MKDGTYDKLCGGTFFTLLLQVRKQRTAIRRRYENERDSFSEPNIFAGLIKVAKPGYIEPEKQKYGLKEHEGKKLKKITSNFKNCNGTKKSESVPLILPAIIETFDKRVKNEYSSVLNDMQEFTNNFIDVDDTDNWLIERLIDLVEADMSIQNAEVFYVCPTGQPISKHELCKLSKCGLDVCLPAFLLGIWHFIICNQLDNNEGRDTIVRWHERNEVEGRLGRFIGPEKSNVERQIKIIGLDESGECTDNTADTVLENDDSFTHRIINDLDNEIETQVVEASQNKTRSEQMKEIFKETIEKYKIAGFMNRDELVPSGLIFAFEREIKSNVLDAFIGSQKEWMYEKIRDFIIELDRYNGILSMVRPSYGEFFYLINANEALLNDFEKSVVPLRQSINSLYGEICNGETLYVY